MDPGIVELLNQKGSSLILPKLNHAYDNHHYRAVYAQNLYKKYTRPINMIPKNERYIMRRDRKGEISDKKAMKIVAESMGHNRISVIAQSYLY